MTLPRTTSRYRPLAVALAAATTLTSGAALAESTASASLTFLVQPSMGFSWVASPDLPSFAEADVNAADFDTWLPTAGTFVPEYGTGGIGYAVTPGAGLLPAAANAGGVDTYATALTFGDATQRLGALSAAAIVPVAGQAAGTAFMRAWFELAPGASVTFRGAVTLAVTGANLAWPAGYVTNDFYGYATGLLAIGSNEQVFEIGGPDSTSAVGSYALNDLGQFLLTLSNTGSEPLVNHLDAGVFVYSASVVPEPSTWALLFAGLGVVGFVALRRRRD